MSDETCIGHKQTQQQTEKCLDVTHNIIKFKSLIFPKVILLAQFFLFLKRQRLEITLAEAPPTILFASTSCRSIFNRDVMNSEPSVVVNRDGCYQLRHIIIGQHKPRGVFHTWHEDQRWRLTAHVIVKLFANP